MEVENTMKKNLFISFILSIMTFLLLTIFFVGCSKTKLVEDSSQKSVSDPVVSTDSRLSLEDYDGWWYIDKDSNDDISLIQIFYLDAKAQECTVYDDAGFPSSPFTARQGDTDELILDLDILGKVPMVLLDSDTLMAEGGRIFRRGEPMLGPDYSIFVGSWYKNGDENGDYYILSDDGSYEYYNVLLNKHSEKKEASETGTYTFSQITRGVEQGESFEILCLTLDDGNGFTTDDFYMLENGVGLLHPGFDNDFYIRKDMLGTPAGEDVISFCTLIVTEPWYEDGGNYLFFVQNGTFQLSTANAEGRIKPYDGGTWSITGEKLRLVWNNGTEETVEYQGGNRISVPSLNKVFTGRPY
jgi:hypothetical protein